MFKIFPICLRSFFHSRVSSGELFTKLFASVAKTAGLKKSLSFSSMPIDTHRLRSEGSLGSDHWLWSSPPIEEERLWAIAKTDRWFVFLRLSWEPFHFQLAAQEPQRPWAGGRLLYVQGWALGRHWASFDSRRRHNGPVLPCINLSQQITGLDLLLAFRGGSCPRHRDLGEVQKRMIGYVMLTRNDFIFYEET